MGLAFGLAIELESGLPFATVGEFIWRAHIE
jgi:hypothetical protein